VTGKFPAGFLGAGIFYNPVFIRVLVAKNSWKFIPGSLLIARFVPINGIRSKYKREIPMSELTAAQVEAALAGYQDKYLNSDYVSAGAVNAIDIDANEVQVIIGLGYPAAGIAEEVKRALAERISPIAGGRQVKIDLQWQIESAQPQANLDGIAGVKNVIAVASGKGGVGKSTTAVNLALALSAEGARVGILDADIYGPSQGLMLGMSEGTRPVSEDGKSWLPIEAHGLQAMTMACMLDDNAPIVWRGPMVTGALQQLVSLTKWKHLDYLIIDLPPGTGDIHLTLAQKVPVTGAVIVTTPQDIALLDAMKGVEMFRKVDIPVLGVVENMSVHICSQCGHAEPIFGSGGGEEIADEYDTELLGQLPLKLSIREQTDAGNPTVVAEPDGEVAAIYRDVARRVAARVALKAKEGANAFPEIQVTDD
jgi:ATP-binding protein involved in chromosome partitioning